ncbi:MAG: hypothetical protein ACI4VF_06455, partial [Lachnospirales bacterium]
MKKIIIVILFITALSVMFVNIYADETNIKVTEAEINITNAASADVNYKSGMIIGSELVEPLIKNALKKKEEYKSSEISSYKNLDTNIKINLTGVYKKFNIQLDRNIKNYAEFVDNIIINANGIYCYINPGELNFDKSENNISLSVNDKSNIIAKYNGSALSRYIKAILIFIFAVAAIYLFVFGKLYLNKQYSDNKAFVFTFSVIMPIVAIILLIITVLV